MSSVLLQNFLSWAVQVFIIGSLGTLLPTIFRIRHPRSLLAYCYVVLAMCIVLPIVQPWQHPVIPSAEVAAPQQTPETFIVSQVELSGRETTSWPQMLLGILIAGAAVRLCWLSIGLWQLRRYRTSATVLYPLPESVVSAQQLTKQKAVVCVSPDDMGPVTFGFLHPIVLLPQRFLSLPEEAQRGIVTHELLHVRRRDWLASLFEEVIRGCFWFQPPVWCLLSQTKLAREQLVDAQVVTLTSAREPYIDALLAMSGAHQNRDLVPAFLRKRHLTQRMHLLLSEESVSKLRLLLSYAAMSLALGITAGLAFNSFPLMGQSQIQQVMPADGAGITVEPGGVVLHRTPIFYPWDAAQKRVEGTVLVELAISAKGDVVDARVLMGPEELRREVLQAVLQWHYAADVSISRAIQVRIDFRAPAPVATAQPQPALDTGKGVLETIDVSELPESLRSEIWQRIRSFKGQPFSDALMSQVEAVVTGADTHLAWRWGSTEDKNHTLKFVLGRGPTPASSQPEPPTGRPRLSINVDERAASAVPPEQPGPPGIATTVTTKLGITPPYDVYRVGNGVTAPRIVFKVDPQYSIQARELRYQGTVVLEAIIQKDGTVQVIRVVRSLGFGLDERAIEALAQWRFEPATRFAEPVPVAVNIEINFNLR